MRTQLTDALKATPEGREADAILRSCVHCGFCLATCPTYRLLGDELDSPRGRIYLIKQVLEGQPVTAKTRLHLDRCLTCRACETTCPSGVQYGRLVDIGRGLVEARTQRPPLDWAKRRALMAVLPRPGLFGTLLGLGRRLQPWLPAALAAKVPPVAGVPPVAKRLAGSAVTAKAAGSARAAPASPHLVPPGARPSAVPGVGSRPVPAGERPEMGLRSGPDSQTTMSPEAGTRVVPHAESPAAPVGEYSAAPVGEFPAAPVGEFSATSTSESRAALGSESQATSGDGSSKIESPAAVPAGPTPAPAEAAMSGSGPRIESGAEPPVAPAGAFPAPPTGAFPDASCDASQAASDARSRAAETTPAPVAGSLLQPEAGSRAANARPVAGSERTTALDADPPAATARPPITTDAITSDAPRPGDTRRTLLMLEGCVQPALAPQINAAAARVLDRLGVSLLPVGGCCGALRFHLNAQEAGRDDMRRNVDAWHAHLEAGAAGIVSTASGCGVTVKDYGHLLAQDPAYRARAERVAGATRDLSEVIAAEEPRLRDLLAALPAPAAPCRVAFHAPCTLQHGQKLVGVVERLLTAAGFTLTPVRDAYLCCGSAGTYALLQPELAQRLLADKLDALETPGPEVIATANIGCLSHLQGGASVPVRHWVELLDERLGEVPAGADGRG